MGKRLPRPKCKWGYTTGQIGKIMGGRTDEFFGWMSSQTSAECTGWEYDHDTKKQRMNGCGPHGNVFYVQDVRNFLDGGPIVD